MNMKVTKQKPKAVYSKKRTPIQQLIVSTFRTYTDYAAAIGVSLPTARRKMEYPHEMTIGEFAQLCVLTKTTAVELFEIIKQSSK